MKHENMQKNYLQKLESLRKLIYSRLPQMESRDFLQIISKLAHYHYDKKKFIVLGLEKELYDFLIENSYNPFTVYRWLLLERVPDDLKFQIKQKKISQKKAISEALKRRHERPQDATQVIREYGLSLIARM
ncbi:MAG: hypothetical protein KAK00_09785 [Nanoarchaeota archaeon]|nr:hypothetical protein [Nanoarchaeota archaeon]